MKKYYWFYLEPYAHVSLKRDHVLIYNPLNGKAVELTGNREAARLVKRLLSPKNLRVVKLSDHDLEKNGIMQLVEKVKDFFLGDLLDVDWSKRKPFQVPPRTKIMKEVLPYQGNDFNPAGADVKGYLTLISFYLNSNGLEQEEPERDSGAYKQFPWPNNTAAEKQELPLERILSFLAEAKQSKLLRINILGKNIFAYSKLDHLANVLNSLPVFKAYYVHYRDLCGVRHPAFESNARVELDIAVNFPLEPDAFSRVINFVKECGIRAKYNFLLENESDVENAEKVISQYNLTLYSFHPFFNGKNPDMFRESVFVSREEILESKPSEKDVLARMWLNPVAFGKLTVLSNGDIHADVNAPKLGNLGVDSLYDVLYKEMSVGKSWRRIRSHVMPCKQCVFEYLCPPLSGYEYALRQNNLCDIK